LQSYPVSSIAIPVESKILAVTLGDMESGGIVVDKQRAENARAFNLNASIQVENQKATLAAVAHAYKAAKSIVCASLYRSGEARDFKTKRRAHAGQLNLGSNSS
jgi:hypothetical protein